MNQDTVSGLYDFPAREYSIQGRWPSPDPAGLGAVDPTNPQSWNRYAYVVNSPLMLIDPTGLDCQALWGGSGVTVICDPIDGGGGANGAGGGLAGGGGCTVENMPDRYADLVAAGYGLPEDDEYYMAAMQPPQRGCGNGGGGNGRQGSTDKRPGGFTLGIRASNQTFKQCLTQNAHTYSAGGATELALNVATGTNTDITSNGVIDFFTGNLVNSLAFGDLKDAGLAGAAQVPGLVDAGLGQVLTHSRRTSSITSLNLAGEGGLPKALGSSTTGLKSALGRVGDILNLGLKASTRLGIDIGLTGAELIGCSIPGGY